MGEIILFLDGDMTATPGFLRAHAEFHRAHPGEVGVGDIRFGPQIPSTSFTRYMESRGAQGYHSGEKIPFKCFVTGNSSARRELLFDIGLFDEEFHAYGGEDLELGYRLHRQGATFRFAGSALSLHHHLRPLDQTCELMHAYGRRSLGASSGVCRVFSTATCGGTAGPAASSKRGKTTRKIGRMRGNGPGAEATTRMRPRARKMVASGYRRGRPGSVRCREPAPCLCQRLRRLVTTWLPI